MRRIYRSYDYVLQPGCTASHSLHDSSATDERASPPAPLARLEGISAFEVPAERVLLLDLVNSDLFGDVT